MEAGRLSRYARKVDANQSELVRQLRQLGVLVHVTSHIGNGFPDLMCGWRGKVTLLEVKDPKQPPSARQLTEKEAEFHRDWFGYPVRVVETLDEALAAVGAKEKA